jgi:hypothetical protein
MLLQTKQEINLASSESENFARPGHGKVVGALQAELW